MKIHNPGRIAHSGATPADRFSWGGGGGQATFRGILGYLRARKKDFRIRREHTQGRFRDHPPPLSRGLWVPLGPGASYLTYQICIHCIHSSTWGHKPNTPLNTVDTYICPCSICTSVHTYMHTQRKGSNILKAVDEYTFIFIYWGRWVAKLVARLLVTTALWIRIQTSLRNTKWRQ